MTGPPLSPAQQRALRGRRFIHSSEATHERLSKEDEGIEGIVLTAEQGEQLEALARSNDE